MRIPFPENAPLAPPPAANDQSRDDQARELELELVRVRAAAQAAHLESRAAEIEIMLRRMLRDVPPKPRHFEGVELAVTASADIGPRVAAQEGAGPEFLAPEIARRDISEPAITNPAHAKGLALPTTLAATSWDDFLRTTQSGSAQNREILAAPREPPGNAAGTPLHRSLADSRKTKHTGPPGGAPAERGAHQGPPPLRRAETTPAPRRSRPAAWVASTVAHAVVLLLLAAFSLSTVEPGDQIALSAATVSTTEETVQTLEFQQTEQPESNSSEQPVAVATDLSPISEVAVQDASLTQPAAVSAPAASLGEMLSTSVSAAASDVATQFFGTRGGGNHFVYLVDNSLSMDNISPDGFDVARDEVLRAVDALTAEQRFYVIFFGSETLRMCLRDPTTAESHSVQATDANKAALRRWAMTVAMQNGRWPEEALEFAFGLRPDCIFLLTDGAMPQTVNSMIRENNIVETLLDGPKRRTTLHTVGFHNREGETQLRKIAEENGGNYHFVPATGRGR